MSSCWNSSCKMENLPQRLSLCCKALISWAGDRFDQLGCQLTTLRKQLDRAMHSDSIKDNVAGIVEIERKIEKLSAQEEIH